MCPWTLSPSGSYPVRPGLIDKLKQQAGTERPPDQTAPELPEAPLATEQLENDFILEILSCRDGILRAQLKKDEDVVTFELKSGEFWSDPEITIRLGTGTVGKTKLILEVLLHGDGKRTRFILNETCKIDRPNLS